jgi:hypothetical protein
MIEKERVGRITLNSVVTTFQSPEDRFDQIGFSRTRFSRDFKQMAGGCVSETIQNSGKIKPINNKTMKFLV